MPCGMVPPFPGFRGRARKCVQLRSAEAARGCFIRATKTLIRSPAARHLAAAAPGEVIEHRHVAAAVPIPGDELDPLARRPAQAGRRPASETVAVDDEPAAPGGLHDLDH